MYFAGTGNITSVFAESDDEVFEVEVADDSLEVFFELQTFVAEIVIKHHEFVVVDFEDVALAEGFFDKSLAVEALAEVYIKHLERGFGVGHSVEEFLYGIAAHRVALRESAEANEVGALGKLFESGSELHIVPSGIEFDFITWLSVGKSNLNNTCGEIDHLGVENHIGLREVGSEFFAEVVVANSTHHVAFATELHCMVGKIGGSTTEFVFFTDVVPKHFAKTNNYKFLFHFLMIINRLTFSFYF